MDDDDEKRNAVLEHTAGATVRHASPFADLTVLVRDQSPHHELIRRWVQPFYMQDPADEQFQGAYRDVAKDVDESLIRDLLSFFNWRPRLVGAYFAAILDAKDTLDVIEPLLLRSDVCYAGRGYCLALARMNTQRSPEVLERYLDYYLTKSELWFDQAQALAALQHLDTINGTARAARYAARWSAFIANKPTWDLDGTVSRFQRTLRGLEACATPHG